MEHLELEKGGLTNFRRALRSQDIDALDYGGARVVDAVDEGLEAAHQ